MTDTIDSGHVPDDSQSKAAAVTGRGLEHDAHQNPLAPAQPIPETNEGLNTHGRRVSAGDEQGQSDVVTLDQHAPLIAELREVHRMRQDLIRAETALTNQIKSIHRRLNGKGQRANDPQRIPAPVDGNGGQGRRGGHVELALVAKNNGGPGERDTLTRRAPSDGDGGLSRSAHHQPNALVADFAALPLIEARAVIHAACLKPTLRMRRIVRQLPIYAFMEGIHGFGEIALAQILGEAGDLSRFPSFYHLNSWMGVKVMPDGKRQRRIAGLGLIENPYCAPRRAILAVIGEALKNFDSPYRDFYLLEKERQRGKMPDASKMHIHKRARRHMEKRLLRDLWRAWRKLHG